MALGSTALSALNITSALTEDLKKAKIKVLSSSGSTESEIEVLFNPSQYVLDDAAFYAEQRLSAMDTPILNYMGGRTSTLNMELFFDTGAVLTTTILTSEKATDVSKKVSKFTKLVYIKGDQHAPPKVKFVWGSLSFYGVVAHIKSTYTRFTESGMPTQAKVNVTFRSVPDSDQKRKEPFESPDRTKCRTVREDWSIWDIARTEYGDVSKWKLIARANQISHPLDILPGTVLKVPAL